MDPVAVDPVPMSVFWRSGALWLPRPDIPALEPQPEPPTIRMVDGRRMQCKDIPDDVFLDAVRRTPGYDGSTDGSVWRLRWKVQETLEVEVGLLPERLFLAKARRLGQRGLLGGCTDCLCRGDYHIAADCPWPLCCPPRNPGGE
jgi:hypothetical protein